MLAIGGLTMDNELYFCIYRLLQDFHCCLYISAYIGVGLLRTTVIVKRKKKTSKLNMGRKEREERRGEEKRGEEKRREEKRKGKERKGKERKGKERKGKERKEKKRKEKKRKEKKRKEKKRKEKKDKKRWKTKEKKRKEFHQFEMRCHLYYCFHTGLLSPFPSSQL